MYYVNACGFSVVHFMIKSNCALCCVQQILLPLEIVAFRKIHSAQLTIILHKYTVVLKNVAVNNFDKS